MAAEYFFSLSKKCSQKLEMEGEQPEMHAGLDLWLIITYSGLPEGFHCDAQGVDDP